MREVLSIAADWVRELRPFALATVVDVAGSAPRGVGAAMIVDGEGRIAGNVSGGCVESAVAAAALECLDDGAVRALHFGIAGDAVFEVGLMCGGSIEVVVQLVEPEGDLAGALCLLEERERAGMPATLTLPLEAGTSRRPIVETADPCVPDAAVVEVLHERDRPPERVLRVGVGSPPRLIIVGAVEFAVALSRLAIATGRRVTVVDPRTAFLTPDRFAGAELVAAWPDAYLRGAELDGRTAVCVLSHDAKLDEPALTVALGSAAGYVGAMGSRSTDADRRSRLARAGVASRDLERLRSPIGLDLGGHTPDETALSVLAEIVAVLRGGSGSPLRERTGSIHGSHAGLTVAAAPGVACGVAPS